MKCPHCKKAIAVTLGNPTRAAPHRRAATAQGRPGASARRSVSLRKNPTTGYTAKFGRKSANFYAQNDKAAETYANGLLAAKMGRAPSSLKRNGKRRPKK